MLEDYFSKPTTLDRIRQSWIAPLIEKHLVWMETQGHAKQTIHRRIPLLVQFGEFAKDRGATTVLQLNEHVSDFVAYSHFFGRQIAFQIGLLIACFWPASRI